MIFPGLVSTDVCKSSLNNPAPNTFLVEFESPTILLISELYCTAPILLLNVFVLSVKDFGKTILSVVSIFKFVTAVSYTHLRAHET